MDKSKKIIDEARARFTLACEVGNPQRDREFEDLRFLIPENQWDQADQKMRAGGDGFGPRPMISISRISQPRQLILNQMRNADLGVLVHPVSEKADDQTAEMLQGLYRHIERKSRAELVRFWAFDRAVACGRGVYRVITEYDDETADPNDQRIRLQRILHQDGVFFDPSANEPDFSDGKFAFVTEYLSRDEIKRRWPESKTMPEGVELENLQDSAPDWFRKDEGDALVVEYWYKEFKTDSNGREVVTVHVCLLAAWEVLEGPTKWLGKYIPLIPVIGQELQPFDSSRRWEGMVRPSRDGQKLYNRAASSIVEEMDTEPLAPYMAPAKATEGYEGLWQQANLRRWSLLPYNHQDDMGNPIPEPKRVDRGSVGAGMALNVLQQADQFIQASTAVFDPSLGRISDSERSGRAILALQQQTDVGTSQYIQNLADVSMTYEAMVVLDLIPKIYNRPGRITRVVMGDDKKSKPVMIGAPFMPDQNTGRPMPVQPDQQGAKFFNLAEGIYDVSVTVGKSYQTRLEEGSDRLGQILQARPELFPVVGDLWVGFQDWPGATEMAERLAKLREQRFPGLGEGEDGEIPPEQMQGMIQQLQQQAQAMEQQLQAAMQKIELDVAKQQATLQKAEMDNQTRLQIAQLEAEKDMAIQGLRNDFQAMLAEVKAMTEQSKGVRESEEKELDREHEMTKLVTEEALKPPELDYRGGADEPLTGEE